MIVDSALSAVAAALELLHERNAELNTPAMVVAALAALEQADWDKIAADIAAGDVAKVQADIS